MNDENNKIDKFDAYGEEIGGYISLEQARVMAERDGIEHPELAGSRYRDQKIAFEVASAEEGDDYYYLDLSVQPVGKFRGQSGAVRYTIDKMGHIETRQVIREPSGRRVLPVLVGVAVTLVIGSIAAVGLFTSGIVNGDGIIPPIKLSKQSPPEPPSQGTSPFNSEIGGPIIIDVTATPSLTPIQPIETPTPTLTRVPPAATKTPTSTTTQVPPAATKTPTSTTTQVPLTATKTPTSTTTRVPLTATSTAYLTPIPPTAKRIPTPTSTANLMLPRPWPALYLGTITAAGQSVPDGMILVGRIGGNYETPPVIVENGRYDVLKVTPPNGSFVGKTLTFYLGDVEADQVSSFQPGRVNHFFNLTFPRLPEATPTPAAPISLPPPPVPIGIRVEVNILGFEELTVADFDGSDGDPYFNILVNDNLQKSLTYSNRGSLTNVGPFSFSLPPELSVIPIEVQAWDSDFDADDPYDISSKAGTFSEPGAATLMVSIPRSEIGKTIIISGDGTEDGVLNGAQASVQVQIKTGFITSTIQ